MGDGRARTAAGAAGSGAVAVRVNIQSKTSAGKILMIDCKETTFIRRSVTLLQGCVRIAPQADGLQVLSCKLEAPQPMGGEDISLITQLLALR
jgi:hypothetical protein